MDYFTKGKKQNHFTSGLRIFSNQIPLRFDSYSGCNNFCRYCYAHQLEKGAIERLHMTYNPRIIKMGDVKNAIQKKCEQIFDRGIIDSHSFQEYFLYKKGLIENGTMGDPFMSEEPRFRVTQNLMEVLGRYNIPMYLNSKLAGLQDETLFNNLCNYSDKAGALIDASIISHNDKLVKTFEPNSISPTERFKIVERLTDNNIDVIISARPIIKGVTDVNYEDFIHKACQSGASSIHLRTLIVSGAQLKNEFWKRYVKEAGMIFKNVQYRYPFDFFKPLFETAKDIAKPYGVSVTASHTMFFEFGSANKGDYTKVNKKIQKGLFKPGITDVLKHTYKHKSEPHLLTYDETIAPFMKKPKVRNFMKHSYKIDAMTATLIWTSSCVRKIPTPFLITGKKIYDNGFWDGWDLLGDQSNRTAEKIRIGYIGTVNQIYVVVDKNKKLITDDNNHVMYAYLPEDIHAIGAQSTHPDDSIPIITTKELREIGIW